MEILLSFLIIGMILLTGYLSTILFKKTNIPDVLVMITVGIILKNTGIIDSDLFGYETDVFTTFALIFILFQGALSINFKTLIQTMGQAVKLVISGFLLTTLTIAAICYLSGISPLISILIGIILGGTTSTIVIPLLQNIELSNKFGSILTLESAISDVLCIVGTITIITLIKTGGMVASEVVRSVVTSFSLGILVGAVFGLLWVYLTNKYDSLSSSYMTTLGVIMILYALVESPYIQGSGAIASLTYGIIFGNSRSILSFNKKNEDDVTKSVLTTNGKNFYSEIAFFLKSLFFVYLGLLIDISNVKIILLGLLITIGVFVVRPFVIKLNFMTRLLVGKERILMEVIIPKGLAAAVLAQYATNKLKVIPLYSTSSLDIVNIVFSVIFFSIFFTSILIFFTEKQMFRGFFPFIEPKTKEQEQEQAIKEEQEKITQMEEKKQEQTINNNKAQVVIKTKTIKKTKTITKKKNTKPTIKPKKKTSKK